MTAQETMHCLLAFLFFLTACAASPTPNPVLQAKAKMIIVNRELDDDPLHGLTAFRTLAPVLEMEALHLTIPDHPVARELRDAVADEKDPVKALTWLEEQLRARKNGTTAELSEKDKKSNEKLEEYLRDRKLHSIESERRHLAELVDLPQDTDIQQLAEVVIKRHANSLLPFTIWSGADLVKDGRYPLLYHAVISDNVIAAEQLMYYGADVHWTDTEGRSLLWHACHEQNEDMVAHLLEMGRDDGFWSKNDYEHCLFSAIKLRREDIVERCLLAGVNANTTLNDRPSLLQAIFAKHEPSIKMLLDHGADVTWRDNFGNSLIMYAVQSKELAIVDTIAKQATELMPMDKQTADALMAFAAFACCRPIAKFAWAHGAKVQRHSPRRSFLISAVKKKNVSYAREMVKLGADVNFRDKHFNTPIYYAVMQNDMPMIHFLLSAGADQTMGTGSIEPLVRMARQRGFHDAVIVLQSISILPKVYLPAAESIVPHVQLHERSRAQFTSNEV